MTIDDTDEMTTTDPEVAWWATKMEVRFNDLCNIFEDCGCAYPEIDDELAEIADAVRKLEKVSLGWVYAQG